MSARKCFAIVSLYFLASSGNLFPQIVLEGVVNDNGSEPVQNALVELTDQADTNRVFSDYTDAHGQYVIQIVETGIDNSESRSPGVFKLSQNYPNPFNPSTVITYELPRPAAIRIEIYNILGQKIKSLFDGLKPSGVGCMVWDATDNLGQGVPAGVYICSLKAEGIRINRKMLLVDGGGSNSNQSQSMQAYGSNRGVFYKQTSNIYSLKITGNNIETYEQQNLEITGNTVHDVTVIRTVTDIDGNVYRTVKIGNQWWMAENLKVSHYRNDDEIPNMKGDTDWSNLTTGAYGVYDDDANNADVYGRLYNWYAVNDSRNIAPAGWHMPSDEEWKELEMVLGMSHSAADSTGYRGTDEGGKLKEAGTSHWFDPNTGATNETGFSALPGGYRRNTVGYHDIVYYTYFWSSTGNGSDKAVYRLLSYKHSKAYRLSLSMRLGFSVRCVKD